MNRPEQALQKAVLEFLALALPGYICVPIPNGGKRSKIEAAIMKGWGCRAGVPDISITGPGFGGWLELKAGKGRLRPSQIEFRDECQRKGIPWAEVRSLEEVENALESWGLSPKARVA